MPELDLDGDRLAFEHHVPTEAGFTFVMFNAMTQPYTAWACVADALHGAGHGTVRFDLRGQPGSTAEPALRLGVDRMASDALALLEHIRPARAVLVGLSIGGLFAVRTLLAGANAQALVLVNTLRRPGPRLSWINDAVLRCVEVGGPELVRDLYTPLLAGEDMIVKSRAQALLDVPYTPIDRSSPLYRLMRDCRDADWDLPYESLELPVLVVTGHQDRVFLEPAVVDALTLRLPDPHRVDFPDAGHLLPAEQPERFAAALVDFVSSL